MTSTSFQYASEQRLFIWEEPGGTVEAKQCQLIEQAEILQEGACYAASACAAHALSLVPPRDALAPPTRAAS